MKSILLFGGTFDPIHNGHMNIARAVQKKFHFDRFLFLPCKIPALKQEAHACAQDRIEMLIRALAEQPKKYHFALDTREILRESPSYTVLTLHQFRAEFGTDFPITLLLGLDSFQQIPLWYQWEKLIDLANILVISRPNYSKISLPATLQTWKSYVIQDEVYGKSAQQTLLSAPYGHIYFFDAGHYNISSTDIREKLRNHATVGSDLNAQVLNYIRNHHLYEFS